MMLSVAGLLFVPHRKQKLMSRHSDLNNLKWILMSIVLSFCFTSVSSQIIRPFPSLFNAAQNRPVVTNPTDSTCGIPTRNAYCISSVEEISINQCSTDYCVQVCPDRTTLPPYADLGIGTSAGFGQCIVTDTVNTKPYSQLGEFSIYFVKGGSSCYVSPSSNLAIGVDGEFSITFWVWQEVSNNGTVMQKIDSVTKEIILQIIIANTELSFVYRSTGGLTMVTFHDKIPPRTWTYIALQVYKNTLSFYVNGNLPGFLPAQTVTLISPVQDAVGTVRIGQNSAGATQFLGRLQDLKFFGETLTNREVEEVYNGSLPYLRVQTECRCPRTHPRVKPMLTHKCIANGVPDSDRNETLRLNAQAHSLEYINDGDSNTVWISKFQAEADVEIDLGDNFQVFFVVLQFYSPFPKSVVIERQLMGSDVWHAWQMFAEDCMVYFGMPNNGPLESPDSVNCIQFGVGPQFVPYSNGSITFSLLSSNPVLRPGYNDFYNTSELFDFVRASKVRVRMEDHYYVRSLRHEYFGLSEFSVAARCECHGHAYNCDTSEFPYKCNCTADSFTIGDKCEQCQPLYNDKPFERGDQINAYNCRPCECHDHADSCVYNVTVDLFPDDHNLGGGGVCINCKHHTAGRSCETCIELYYRPTGKSKYDPDVCELCNCDPSGVKNDNLDCEKAGGQCLCKTNVQNRQCDQCKVGFFNLMKSNPDGCEDCSCNKNGTLNGDISCHPTTGVCSCKQYVRNAKCDACKYGFFNLTSDNPNGCTPCTCNPEWSTSQFCDPVNGQCQCKDNVVGRLCDECVDGHYNLNGVCTPCRCDIQGSVSGSVCNKDTGQCVCKDNVEGIECNVCKDGSFGFGISTTKGCQDCTCNLAGTVNSSNVCNKVSGDCFCKDNVEGMTCNKCKGNTFGLNITNPDGCQECACDRSGTQGGDTNQQEDLTCDQSTGACTCLANRIGRSCDDCAAGYYVNTDPGGGCNSCGCNAASTIPLTYCDSQTGQCQCKGGDSGVTGRTCTECMDGYYNFDKNEGKCTLCDCEVAGSLNYTCDDNNNGQCSCKLFVTGRRCDTCATGASLLDANNPYGCSKEPTQQPPPDHDQISHTELRIYWKEPDHPNGVINKYLLIRNGTLIFNTSNPPVREYMDKDLLAYTVYSYIVEAYNDYGHVRSPAVTFRTLPTDPVGMIIVQVTDVTSNSAHLTWNQPVLLNGPLANYTIYTLNPKQPFTPFMHWKGLTRAANVTTFSPFTNYTVYVVVCSTGGCLSSMPTYFNTKSALPTGMKAPVVTMISHSELKIKWAPPTNANGLIIYYELWMRGALQPDGTRNPIASRIFHPSGQYNPQPTMRPQENALPPPATEYTLTGLEPYTVYEFQVLAQNEVGKAASPWVAGKTGEATPLFMKAPVISAISNTELELQWDIPSEADALGVITSFRVYFYEKTDTSQDPFAPPYIWKLVATTTGDTQSHMITDLSSYSNYTFKLGACNSVGCVNSSESTGRTLEDTPEGLSKPKVDSLNSTTISVTWHPPMELNGPAPIYSVEKSVPSLSFPADVIQGTRFPGGGYYLFPPETLPTNVAFTGIKLRFRTRQKDGLILFAASAGNQEEFVVIQFKSGRPWFLFDPQGCTSFVEVDPLTDDDRIYSDNEWHLLTVLRDDEYARINIDGKFTGCVSFVTPTNDEGLLYSDMQWHELFVMRDERKAHISIDKYWKGTRESNCNRGTVIGPSTGVYIGGLPSDFVIRRTDYDQRVQVIEQGFQGCIKDVEILQQLYPVEVWKRLDWADAQSNEFAYLNWEGCPTNLGSGTHFMGQGYVVLPADTWDMHDETSIEFSFRTDLGSSLMFFAHGGERIYFFIALISNALYFEFSNSIATGSVTFRRDDLNFCNGTVYYAVVSKKGQQASITVTGYGTESSGDPGYSVIVKTVSDLYMGGIPEKSEAAAFIYKYNLNVPSQGFGGCMSEPLLKAYPYYSLRGVYLLTSFTEIENVNLDGCAPAHIPETTCKGDIVENIYNGTDLMYHDSGLQPYSDYLYRVLAINEAGTGASSWTYARTKQGAPIGVKPPYNVKVLSGYVINGSWSAPERSAGLLQSYRLRAYSLDDPTLPPVEAIFYDTDIYTGQITNAVPHTNYSVKVAICSGGGCTESSTGVQVTTMEEAPEDLPKPTAVIGTSHLYLQWEKPGKPNGNITGYFLYKDDVQIYGGGEMSFNLTGLQVYTTYVFYVRACTKVGCTNGPSVLLSTAQLPPTFVKAPTVISLGTTKAEARWVQPEQVNGVLQRYLLYASLDNTTLGEEVYNNSDLFTDYIITELTAGMTYFITLSACTMGGCTHSESSNVTTEESAPEGVPDPVITSPSSSELIVTWESPTLPNGHIIRYELYHNEVKVYTGLNQIFTITGLTPYSLHTLRVAACTVKGCGSSAMVDTRTREAPPSGFIIIEITVTSARSVNVKWNSPDKTNGIIYYDIYFDGHFYSDPDKYNFTLVTDRRSLFRGTNYSVWIDVQHLIPMSQYGIQVNASNNAGFILSNTLTADMPEGTPDGVIPPNLVSESPTSMKVTWKPVGRANSKEEPLYILQFRDLIYNGTTVYDVFGPTTTFIYTKHDLKPYTEYEFRVVASNSHGSSRSMWMKQVTKQDKPKGFDPPMIVGTGARFLDVVWQPPLVPNGVLIEYKLFQNNDFKMSLPVNRTSVRVDNLEPFTLYMYSMEVCTLGGCTASADSSTERTLEDMPEGLSAPQLVTLTPTSVEIKWSPPLKPNGLINEYIIERRKNYTQPEVVVARILPTVALVYVDDGAELSPFTSYDYRVKVVNGAGTGTSTWETIRTMSSRPTGVMPPDVQVVSPYMLSVTWQPPLKPNGLLEYYVVRLPSPRIEIRNISVMSLTVDSLLPYTIFSVTLTACTDGGCTESSPVVVRTNPAVPENQSPPYPVAVSQTMITITWQGPERTNGPNLRFELARKKITQPLEANPSNLNIWQSVYIGTLTYYEDRGLSIFTTFLYRITVYNSVGQITSNPSGEVTTYGGFPRKAADVDVLPIDHLTLQVTWITPSVVDLQGSVTKYILTADSAVQNVTETLGPEYNSTMLGNLTPNTEYFVQLTMMIHGGATITSQPVSATTLDGAPEGIASPVVTVLTDTSVRVSWTAPTTPNGDITGYNIYQNDNKIPTGLRSPGSFILSQLLPYTVYSIQIEVCTLYDCTKSAPVFITTAEAMPSGFALPTAVSGTPTSVNVTWTPPEKPNGIILRYDLYRKTIKSCSEVPPVTMSPELTKCTYVECSILENLCGGSCYSGAKICCDGVLHNAQDGFDCCGKEYVPKATVDAVCCGGHFYEKKDNYKCCGYRYIEVLPRQTCCIDSVEDRVTVGYGDMCCKTIPYSSLGAQLCCDGQLIQRYGQQCCGGKVISQNMTCCGDYMTGSMYVTEPNWMCCGHHYANINSSLCCTSDTGHSKVHLYPDLATKEAANEECCGLETISKGLGCCNYVGYNPYTHVCADVSNGELGCGEGIICHRSLSDTAFCDRCDFNKSTTKCGAQSGYHGNYVPTTTIDPLDNCVASEERLYSGMELKYADTKLDPYSLYQYYVIVINSAGGTRSNQTSVTTLQAAPEGVNPPVAMVDPAQLYAIQLSWRIPDKPNGEIISFILTRDAIELYRGLAYQYIDDNAILPYKSYVYILTACTSAGCTSSPEVTVATAQSKPEDVLPPTFVETTSRSLKLSWSAPGKPNGIVTGYLLRVENSTNSMSYSLPASQLSLKVIGLMPYTNYSAELEACTDIGCTKSHKVYARTQDDLPEGVQKPRIVVISSTTVLVFWDPPSRMNGMLKFYAIMRIWSRGAKQIYLGMDLSASDQALTPGQLYTYYIIVGTSMGNTSSPVASVSMPTKIVENIPSPELVTVQSSTQIYVEWDPVVTTMGIIDRYGVVLNAGQISEVEKSVGLNYSTVVTGLKPFFIYEVRLKACLADVPNGCGMGVGVTVQTFEAPPTDLNAPTLTAVAANIIDIEWKPPVNPNGNITQYLVYYRKLGTTVDLLINRVTGDVFSIRHAGQDLQPYTQYQFKVVAGNSKGDVSSAWATVRTFEAPPDGMLRPLINATSAFGFSLSWQPPTKPNGAITGYKIVYKLMPYDIVNETPTLTISVSPNTLSSSVSGLNPYSNYEVFVEVFNSVGHVSSDRTIVQTGESSPSGIAPFTVEKITSGTAVILRWDSPSQPNGVITLYRIFEDASEVAVYQGITAEFEFRRLKPFTLYEVKLEVCTGAGCSMGKPQTFVTAETAPSDQPSPIPGFVNATCVLITWVKPINANGKITMYEVLRTYQARIQKRSPTEPIVVYQTTDTDASNYEYLDFGLEPFSEYQYSIRASNKEGSTQSPWQSIFTDQSSPEGLDPPKLSYIAQVVDGINIKWSPPAKPNGVIQNYQLQRNTSVPLSFAATDKLEFNDSSLLPYTMYGYTVKACTTGGCTKSQPSFMRTKETAPILVTPPTLVAVNSTAIEASWKMPLATNGEITLYQLIMNGMVIYSGDAMSHIEAGLIPYQEYTFILKACTNGGCTSSGEVSGRPDDAVPSGLLAPVLNVISSKAIEITWKPPLSPNGVITSYDLRRDGSLIYTESVSIAGSLATTYVDYGLEPGIEYSYVVIARNRKGSTESPASKATTYSASPSGLQPPVLQALSSTSIQAMWQPPAKPNGAIKNYTLYQTSQMIISGGPDLLSFVVPGLLPWTQYSFRIQTCTDRGCELSASSTVRTLEAKPEELQAPALLALANQDGAHDGVLVTWETPLKPNGIIVRYEVLRRRAVQEIIGISYTELVSVYNGTQQRFSDFDPGLRAYTDYQYMVVAANSAGTVDSLWTNVKTKEGPPESLIPPLVNGTSPTTISVTLTPPIIPNGVIRYYSVLVNGTVGSTSVDLHQVIGLIVALRPYTLYSIQARACTAGGCTESSPVTVRTGTAKPTGQAPVSVTSTTNTTATLTWTYPTQPNGEILRFILYKRSACPLSSQPFQQPCTIGEAVQAFTGIAIETTISNLDVYTAYEFQIVSENQAGAIDFPTWIRAETKPSDPEYIRFPLLSKNNSRAGIDWSYSFRLNGRLREYILLVGGRVLFRGINSLHMLDEQTSSQRFTFMVTVITDIGQAESPSVVFDPNAIDNIGTTQNPSVTQAAASSDILFYQEIWFIVLLVLVAILLIFVIVALCLRNAEGRRPYIRERSPLKSSQQRVKSPFRTFEDESSSSSGIFETEMSARPYLSGKNELYDTSIGVTNPGYSNGYGAHFRSRKSSLSSSQFDDEDFFGDDGFLWEKQNGRHMFSREEGQSTGGIPTYSFTKEQTVFTDTHL